MHYARIAAKVREQIIKFSGELSAGLPKVVRRFIAESLYGIQARQSVRLTEIARSLEEEIPLRKTQYRLCRQVGRDGLWKRITHSLLRRAASRIREDTLLIMDLSDISKKYARKMEYLSRVWDGSEGTVNKGYWTCNVVGAEVGETALTPLYCRLFSQDGPDFQSENAEIRKAVSLVAKHTEKRGIWVMDRGGDSRKIIDHFLNEDLAFIIRSEGKRHLVYRGRKNSGHALSQDCSLPYMERVVREEGKNEKVYFLEFGMRPVKLPGRQEQMYLVVVRGFGKDPMMILTNKRVKRSRKSIWEVVESYITRWRIEETLRFIKQSYNLEDIRLLTYTRLQNMMALVLTATYFAMVCLGFRQNSGF